MTIHGNRARALMVWGCTSDAGKSLLTTALCRWFADRGIDVAPFKAQNMSNNARVADLGEMGSAQWFQALAARQNPAVCMNPVLLKPEADNRSQVIVRGRARLDLGTFSWRDRSRLLAEVAFEDLDLLQSRHELILLEGAGSPAETNLADVDYVNHGVVRRSNARALLVADIDRGGAFAHLHGTWIQLPEDLRPRLGAFVLNKFRGDTALLPPAPDHLTHHTGVPLAGILPMVRHGLPDEDAASLPDRSVRVGQDQFTVAVVGYPRIAVFDEFRRLADQPGVDLHVVREPSRIEDADLVILPGSKGVADDLAWLRSRGFEDVLRRRIKAHRPVLGVCGGFQMLGVRIEDPLGIEGACEGLGLLPIVTRMHPDKAVTRRVLRLGVLEGPWNIFSRIEAQAWEIRHGRTIHLFTQDAVDSWSEGAVLGVALHGLLEDAGPLGTLLGAHPAPDPLEKTFDLLADLVDRHLDMNLVARLALGRAL